MQIPACLLWHATLYNLQAHAWTNYAWSFSSLAQASFDIRLCQVHAIAQYCDRCAMSSYVFQFFCGPEGIALANPGAARARPALAGPPQRPTAELVFAHPGRPPAARLRSASASAEPDRPRRARRSPSGHRRRHRQDRQDRHDRDRRHHRHHHHRRPGGQQRLPPTDLQGSGKRRHKGHRCQHRARFRHLQQLFLLDHPQGHIFNMYRPLLSIKLGECRSLNHEGRHLGNRKHHSGHLGLVRLYSNKDIVAVKDLGLHLRESTGKASSSPSAFRASHGTSSPT